MPRTITQLDAPMWRMVRLLYYKDKVVEALEEAERLGGQDSNELFAEADLRARGSQVEVEPWLTVEAIADQIGDALPQTLETIRTACAQIAERFEWDFKEKTFVAMLPQEVEEPWMPGRWGYFVDKVPYDKICLPYHLAANQPELDRTVRHEFMHQISAVLSNARAPRWLTEALSIYSEGGTGRRIPSGAPWLGPDELNGMLERDNRDATSLPAIASAYAQAGAIGRFLAHFGGDRRLADLLKAIGEESVKHGIEERFLGRSRADGALKTTYGMSEREAFENARSFQI